MKIKKTKRKLISSSDFEEGSSQWKYARMCEERRGNSFEYWNDKHEKMLKLDWDLYKFDGKFYTESIIHAKEVVYELHKKGNYARIICGYEKVVQRVRYFSVIYKKKEITA